MFFIDHEQSEVFKSDFFSNDFVSADENVDFAVGKVCDDLFHVFWFSCTRDEIYFYGQFFETFAECVIVLHGKHSGRDKHSSLLAIDCSLESCSNGDLCFAKSDITTNEAVHGSW